ncbi:MAG TPA: ABC transporter ATP-binding protein [Victivallales bacterium]|nr:ABC transporter ATP-binding protein [Victivallales bacterium]
MSEKEKKLKDSAAHPTSKYSSSLLLNVQNLKVVFNVMEGCLQAVNGVSFTIERGKVMALVGESGCGKTVTSYSILKLIQAPGKIVEGSIVFNSLDGYSVDMVKLSDNDKMLYKIRGGKISMIFQEPMTAFSPVHTIGDQICEAILLHQKISKQEAKDKAIEMMRKVGISFPEKRIFQYPFEMSGGMRQRAMIAMALVCNPELLIADEPTTALDVTIQAQIIFLIKKLQQELGTSILLITHDLGVVAQMADDVSIMYLGKIVEKANVKTILKNPQHPYTKGLIKSLPGFDNNANRLFSIKGSVPSLLNIPSGCAFYPRCEYFKDGICNVGNPPPLEEITKNHFVACARIKEI